jgi:predicted metal-dependent peptidase
MNIQSIIRNDYSFARPSRKAMHSGAILPGMKNDETIDVAIAIDMSGSIGVDDAHCVLERSQRHYGPVSGLCHRTCGAFDTEIYNHVRITHDNGDDLLSYEPKGGGGTDFMANWEYMKTIGLQPKKFIMFTDLYPCGELGRSGLLRIHSLWAKATTILRRLLDRLCITIGMWRWPVNGQGPAV